MSRPPSAEELEQLAKIWFADAHQLSARDRAEFDAWRKEYRKWTHIPGSGFSGGISSGDFGEGGSD